MIVSLNYYQQPEMNFQEHKSEIMPMLPLKCRDLFIFLEVINNKGQIRILNCRLNSAGKYESRMHS